MNTDNSINLVKYFRYIYQYILLFFILLFFSIIIFFVMGNYKIISSLEIKFNLKTSQIDKVIKNLIHLERTFGTNFNNQVIPLQGNPDTKNHYNLLLNNLKDIKKNDLNLSNLNEDEKKLLGFKISTETNNDVNLKFSSLDKILISKIYENNFNLFTINLIKNKFYSNLENNIEVIRNISELEFDRINRKLNKKNEQLLRLTNFERDENLSLSVFNLQNQIIDLEDEYINNENRLILCEQIYLATKKYISEISFLREFYKSQKILLNDIILNILLYFLFTCIVFFISLFILVLIKESKKNE